ncbi:hypothetical protein PHET_04553 [Paragonimus heterotremus]|uniref:PKD domain-containing protein n=1 Tax=Paragonimus heterotremus TaxID=100268 RepID=A0A8J4WS33_9TREM|nr:hypothetical protein PHET_04553 [Paragonimus heterotremus]
MLVLKSLFIDSISDSRSSFNSLFPTGVGTAKFRLVAEPENAAELVVLRATFMVITTKSTQIFTADVAELNVALPNALGSGLLYYIYFGDVIGYKEQIATVDQPISVQYTKTASAWVNIEAKTATGNVMSSGGLTLQVIEKLVAGDVTFTCPQMAIQDVEIECTVQLTAGSHLLGSIQFGAGTLESFTVPESGWEMMHPSASRFTGSTTKCPDATLIIPGTSARYTGLLSEINLHAAISGSFKLLHLRVKCSSDKYNYDQNTCTKVDTNVDCLYATSNKVFSMDVQDCVDPALTGCEKQLRRLKLGAPSTVEPYDYEVVQVGSWTKRVHEMVLSGTISQIGDATIFLSLSTFENGLNEVFKNNTVSIVSPLSTDGLEKAELKTNMAATLRLTNVRGKPSNFYWNFGDGSPEEMTTVGEISHTYTKAGDYNLALTMSNMIGFIVIQKNVVVRDELLFNGIIVNRATVGLPTTLTLDMTDGPGITCTWTIQGTTVHVGPEKLYMHTYDKPGEFSVSVTCTNLVYTMKHTAVQEAYESINGLAIEANSVSIGSAQSLVFNFAHGSNLTVNLQVDGQVKTVQIDYVHRRIISETLSVAAPVEIPYVINVSNALGWQGLSETVRFDEPMEGLSVTFEPPRGTSIQLTIDFNDTNVYNEPVNKLQNWPQNYEKIHRYTKAGTYIVKLSASGGSKQDMVQLTVSVQGTLGTYELEPANSYTGRNDLFTLLINRVAGDIAVMAQVSIDWGDKLTPFSDRFVEGKKIGHVYTSTGDFTITVTLTMNTNVKTYTTRIGVREPIRNFGCSLLANPIKFGDTVSVAVSLRNGEQVTITAQFEVGQPSKILQQKTAEPVMLNYTYLTTGQHNISIEAANLVGKETCLLNVDVRKPIADMSFEFQALLENYEGETSILIRYAGKPVDFPAGLSYAIDWADSSPLEVGSLDKPFVEHKIEHVLTRLSYFQVSAKLDNQVSRYETTSKIGVFGRIGYIKLQITVAATGEAGYGEKHDRFAAGNPLKLMVLSDDRPDNVAETLFEILDVASGENTSLTWVESNYQLFTFTKQGQMRIFAEGRNPFSQAFTSMNIYIGSDLRGFRGELLNASVLSPQKPGLFRLFFEAISESSCICVQKDDQTGPIVFPAKDKHAKDCSSCPSFNPVYERPSNNVLDIQLNYPSPGNKQLEVTAENPAVRIMQNFTVTVSQLKCDPPHIRFIEDSIKSPSSPLTVESNKPVIVGANITGDVCTPNEQNTIRWSVLELDVDTLNPIRQVNVSDQPSTKSSELFLPANRLKPGFYVATIRVDMSVAPGAPMVSSQANAYIHSAYPPLMIQLYDGNPESVDVGLAQETICLNPQKYSYDPAVTDENQPQGIINWSWYCAKAGEQFTENVVVPKPQGHVFGGSRTGCFGDGPGRIDVQSGQLCFWSGNFEPKTLYKIKVIGFKPPSRMGSAITTLNCDTQAALLVQLKCTLPEQCKPNNPESTTRAAWAISSTEDLYLTSSIESVWNGTILAYTWELKYIYAKGDGSFLSSGQMEIYTEGFSTPTLKVKKEFFTADHTAIGIKVCAAVITNGNTGVACLRVVFFEPPVTGKLKTSPRTVVGVSHDPVLCAQIPASGNGLSYCVQASDQHGSTEELCFGTVKAVSKLVGVISTMVPNTADSIVMTSAAVNAVLKNREDMDRQSQSILAEVLGGYAVSLPTILARHDISKRQEVIAQVIDNALHLAEVSVSQINDSVPKDIERNPKFLDYNVDLESPGLTDSEDNIWEELSLQNSAADQSKVASSASNVLTNLLQTHSGLLQAALILDNTPTVTTTNLAVLGLHKLDLAQNVSVTMPANKDGSSATVPDLCSTVQKLGMDCNLPLTVQSLTSDFNMFAFVDSAPLSIPVPPEWGTVTLLIYNDTNQMSLENTDKPFEILLRRDSKFVSPTFSVLDESTNDVKLPASRIAADNSEVYQALLVSEISLPDSNSGVTFQLKPGNLSACPQYLVVGRMLEPPVISRVGGKFDFWGTIPTDTGQCDQMQVDPDELNYPYTFFVNNKQLTKAKLTAIKALGDRKLSPEALQKVYMGFRELNDQERNKYNPDNPPPFPYPFRDQINNTAISRMFVSSCVSTNTERPTSWSSAGCDVGPNTTIKQTQCFCYHLSTFAAGYLQLPNKLNFDYIFANMDFEKNPTLYGTEIAIFLLFLPLFIWARRKDVKDMEKVGG